MGTTQRISPGVPYEPNWKQLNRSITQIAKTVERENEQGDEDLESQQTDAQKKQANGYEVIIKNRERNLRSAFNSLIKTGGGTKSITSGKSKSIGRAGIRSSSKIVSFVTTVGDKGLRRALDDIGFTIAGKNVQDVIDYLLIYSSDSSAGMDETAANKASCEVLNDLAKESNNNLDEFEKIIKGLLNGKELASLLSRFWGYYIFEHLSQRFQEKVVQKKGEQISGETFRIIKEDILGQVMRLNEKREVSKIDWKGKEGQDAINKIFESVINILCDEN
jgi:hypothetical protein